MQSKRALLIYWMKQNKNFGLKEKIIESFLGRRAPSSRCCPPLEIEAARLGVSGLGGWLGDLRGHGGLVVVGDHVPGGLVVGVGLLELVQDLAKLVV